MTIKRLIAFCAVSVGLVAFADNPLETQEQVEQGKWCSDFPAAKAYAEANNIPLLVFWANPGCGQCGLLENACREDDFLAWQAERKLVMVFAYGKSTATQKAAYQWIRNVQGLKEFPFIGVYWKSNGSGQTVESVFVGRKKKMPVKTGTLEEQLMSSVDQLISGWNPGGAPTPTPTPTPDPDYREQAYGAQQKVSLLVTDSQLGTYVGTAAATIGKLKNGQVKVSVKVSLFTGKSYSANKSVDVAKDGSATGALAFKDPINAVAFQLAYDPTANVVTLACAGEKHTMGQTQLQIGGAIGAETLAFNGAVSKTVVPEGYAFVTDQVPVGEPIYVKNGTKFSFDKAPTLKYVKEDGEYVLKGLDDPAKPNVNALKLSYKSSTGIFSGTYYAYISNAATATGKPKLTKCKAKVYGAVIGGVGYGEIVLTVGKSSYSGTCELR